MSARPSIVMWANLNISCKYELNPYFILSINPLIVTPHKECVLPKDDIIKYKKTIIYSLFLRIVISSLSYLSLATGIASCKN